MYPQQSTNGVCLRWRKTLKLVKSCVRRWQQGDITRLWDEVMAEQNSHDRRWKKCKKSSEEELRKANVHWVRLVVEDGQYRKAIQVLTSGGLVDVTPDVLMEMHVKHPQAPLPLLLQVLPTSGVSRLKSSENHPCSSAPSPSSLRTNHLKEAVMCPSLDHAAEALCTLTSVVNLLCAGRAPPSLSHISVVPPSCLPKRWMVVSAPSQLGRFCVD